MKVLTSSVGPPVGVESTNKKQKNNSCAFVKIPRYYSASVKKNLNNLGDALKVG